MNPTHIAPSIPNVVYILAISKAGGAKLLSEDDVDPLPARPV